MTVTITKFEKSIRQLDGEGDLLRQQAAAWVTEFFGERCPEFHAGCEPCERWQALDRLFERIGDE